MMCWLHPDAEAELAAAAQYYAQHASVSVANAYLREFERLIRIMQANQQIGSLSSRGLRTYPFRRFPFTIIYREDPDGMPKIYAVAHQRRKPGYWAQRSDG